VPGQEAFSHSQATIGSFLMPTILIVPGLNDSCANHWQSWFERTLPNAVRVRQRDWSTPDLQQWGKAVQDAAQERTGPVWVVAHSFGCLAAAWAAVRTKSNIAGAMLVAPADPARFGVTFVLPKRALPCKTVLVASENDPWMPLEGAQTWCRTWGATLVNVGLAGHINTASGHGPWPAGLRMFRHLQISAERALAIEAE
jgi:uncharacterized protein